MAFSGSGSNATKNHTHDSNILEDGGSLDFKNITQAALSNGSICFSDGLHLQERNIGAASEILTVVGGVPDWAAAPAGGITNPIVLGTQSRNLDKWLEIAV